MARQVATDGFYGTVAPTVERSPEEAGVGGSNPPRPTWKDVVFFTVFQQNASTSLLDVAPKSMKGGQNENGVWARSSAW